MRGLISPSCRCAPRSSLIEGAPRPATVGACYTTAVSSGDLKDRLLGDGLVPVMSALGRHKESARDLHFASDRQWIACETGRLDLLSRRDVYERMAGWIAQP